MTIVIWIPIIEDNVEVTEVCHMEFRTFSSPHIIEQILSNIIILTCLQWKLRMKNLYKNSALPYSCFFWLVVWF